jgi:hypothetical protein
MNYSRLGPEIRSKVANLLQSLIMKKLMMQDGAITALDVRIVESGREYVFFLECCSGEALFGLSGNIVVGGDGKIVTALITPWINSLESGSSEIVSDYTEKEESDSNVVRPDFRRAAAG